MIVLNHCQSLFLPFSSIYYFPSHLRYGDFPQKNGFTIPYYTISIHFLYIQYLLRNTLNMVTRIILLGRKTNQFN